MNKPSASAATITHAARAMTSQRPCKVVVRGGEVRVLIPPFPGPCWPAPSVTTPLYSTTVSKVLRGQYYGPRERTSENPIQAKFAERLQSVVRCLGSALVSGWCQIASSATAMFEKYLQNQDLQIRHTL